MNILEVRKIIAEALQQCDALDQVFPLGNCVYVHVDNQEYEVVIRTVRPERGWHDSNPYGPVAQE